jgi:hypothetical protein
VGKRIVFDKIERTDGSPWTSAEIRFLLTPGSYTLEAIYPSDKKTVKANTEGEFEVELWTNNEGVTLCQYYCYLPSGESFTFRLPSGDTPIRLSTIRLAGPVPPEQQPTIVELIDDRIESHNDDPTAHPETREILTIVPGNTVFTLSQIPANPHLSQLYLNGIKATFGIEYNINAAQLSWLSPLPLEPTDSLEVIY